MVGRGQAGDEPPPYISVGDERGNAIWTARQMAVIPSASGLATAPGSGNHPDVSETAPFSADVTYDTARLYEQFSEYDYANRVSAA